jgi:3-hydroxyisobutyrate dehydrogenase-like beta-hydroxyacid dehydrogenase
VHDAGVFEIEEERVTLSTVGLLSPGDMGHSIGAVLKANGLEVLTCLAGRSERTRALAAESGFADVASLEELVTRVDLLLCVLVPAQATTVAAEVAAAIRATGADLLYVDCNAIAPSTVEQLGEVVQASGARFADVGIVGPPPRRPGTRFYASGPGAAEFAELSRFGLDVRVIGERIGQASGFKMCYAALTKGLQALGIELLVAANRMGLEESLRAEQRESVGEVLSWLERSTPTMPPKAHRWVGEMEEIAKTFADLGMTPKIFEGAADIYRMVAGTSIGRESPETRDQSRGLEGIVDVLGSHVASELVNARR